MSGAAWVGVVTNVDYAPLASIPGAPRLPAGAAVPEPLPLEPGYVLTEPKSRAQVQKRLAKARVLDTAGAGLVVRRSAVAPALEGVDGLRLRPAAVRTREGELVDEDWLLVELEVEWPLDRDAARARWFQADNPHGSTMLGLERVAFLPDRAPRVGAVRLGELPALRVWRRDLADRLKVAAGPGLVLLQDLSSAQAFARAGKSDAPPQPGPGPDAAAEAGRSFWAALAGGGSPELRGGALRSPHYALWWARLVDRAPADDTRASACRDPWVAADYALLVDEGARGDTRDAAARHSASAQLYARHVDRALHPATARALRDAGWGEADLDWLGLPRVG